MQKRIAIVGGGPSGLAAARRLARIDHHDVTIFERESTIGGVWAYAPKRPPSQHTKAARETAIRQGNAMYHDLRVNLPCEIMHFPGYTFRDSRVKNPASFVTCHDVQEYLLHEDIPNYKFQDGLTDEADLAELEDEPTE